MYLNANLTPPATSVEASCSTPKTPEVLNSLLSLLGPPLPKSYDQYIAGQSCSQSSVPTCVVLSPVDSSQDSPTGSSSASEGSSSTTVVFPTISPVSTVQATKSALIKEGLKLQIKSKLQAAGIQPQDIVVEEKVPNDELTIEDEDRRKRRRERNKIAATKCRNKKKEKTVTLLAESQAVVSQNAKLKSEVERLSKEKLRLERLLEDPVHRASCVCPVPPSNKSIQIPEIVVSPSTIAMPSVIQPVGCEKDDKVPSTSNQLLSLPVPSSNHRSLDISNIMSRHSDYVVSSPSSFHSSPISSTRIQSSLPCGSQYLPQKLSHIHGQDSVRHHPYHLPLCGQKLSSCESLQKTYDSSTYIEHEVERGSYNSASAEATSDVPVDCTLFPVVDPLAGYPSVTQSANSAPLTSFSEDCVSELYATPCSVVTESEDDGSWHHSRSYSSL